MGNTKASRVDIFDDSELKECGDMFILLDGYDILHVNYFREWSKDKQIGLSVELDYSILHKLTQITDGKIAKITYKGDVGVRYHDEPEFNPIKQKAQSHIPYSSSRRKNSGATWSTFRRQTKRGH